MANKLKKRNEVEPQHKWKIEDLYQNDEQWQEEVEVINTLVDELKQYQGKLGDSAESLYSFLSLSDKVDQLVERVYVYANQKFHEDTTNGTYQELADKATNVMMTVNSALSFTTPEILTIPEERIRGFYEEKIELLQYQRMIQEIMKDKPHTLSSEMEELLAQTAEIANASVVQPLLQEMNSYWTPAETMGKELVQGDVTKENAAEKTEAMTKGILQN